MVYPSLIRYIETFVSLEISLRTLGSFRPFLGDDGLPRYSCSGGVAWFTVVDEVGAKWLMGVFLSNKARGRFSVKPTQRLIEAELMVEALDRTELLDVVLRQCEFNPTRFKLVSKSDNSDSQTFYGEGFEPFEDKTTRAWGFYNPETGVRLSALWSAVELFVEGCAVVELDGRYGLIDTSGNLILKAIYDEVSWDGSRYAYVDLGGKWGVYSRSGELISALQWDWIGEFSYGYALVQRDSKYGFIDSQGELVIEPKYDDAGSFNQYGAAQVRVGKEKFFIDHKQRRV
ncbi:MAG: WG repeat-containing protein [Rikenellaceae bacterium]